MYRLISTTTMLHSPPLFCAALCLDVQSSSNMSLEPSFNIIRGLLLCHTNPAVNLRLALASFVCHRCIGALPLNSRRSVSHLPVRAALLDLFFSTKASMSSFKPSFLLVSSNTSSVATVVLPACLAKLSKS